MRYVFISLLALFSSALVSAEECTHDPRLQPQQATPQTKSTPNKIPKKLGFGGDACTIATSQPKSAPATKKGAAYSILGWKDKGQWKFSLVQGSKTSKETFQSADELKTKIQDLPEGSEISWKCRKAPQDLERDIASLCESNKLKFVNEKKSQ